MVWELFSNTHHHGREDCYGNIIKSNLRAIIVQQQDITTKYIQAWNDSEPAKVFQKIWHDYLSKQSTSKHLHVLDISVIDLGGGLAEVAERRKLCDLTASEEINVTYKCINTSWSRTGRANRGSGFLNVLRCVQKHKGWLRIRTGRVVIEKTFQQEDRAEIAKSDIKFLECPVVGTSIHISFPLNEEVLPC